MLSPRHLLLTLLTILALQAPLALQAKQLAPPPEVSHENTPSWWTPTLLIDYGIIAAGAASWQLLDGRRPSPRALIGPSYDAENPADIFHHPDVSGTFREHNTGERVPNAWLYYASFSTGGLLAAFEGAQWAFGDGSGLLFHETMVGFAESMALSLSLTTISKLFFGRLRPDFGERALRYHCPLDQERFGDVCDGYAERPIHADPQRAEHLFHDGRQSFVSGHSSTAFTLATYSTLILGGRYVWGDQATPLSRTLGIGAQTLLVAAATYTATSRILDERHHTTDVLAGTALGLLTANLSYWRRFHLSGAPRRGRTPLTKSLHAELNPMIANPGLTLRVQF